MCMAVQVFCWGLYSTDATLLSRSPLLFQQNLLMDQVCMSEPATCCSQYIVASELASYA